MKIPTKSTDSSAKNEDGKKDFITVPEGKYLAKISRISRKQSERTGSKSVQMAFEVTNGAMAGNAVFENFLYDHPNEKALEVSLDRVRKLGNIFSEKFKSPEDLLDNKLLDQELIIHVKNTTREYDGEKRTYANVKKFEPGL